MVAGRTALDQPLRLPEPAAAGSRGCGTHWRQRGSGAR